MTGWPLYQWFFFRFSGRIGRWAYFLGFMLLSVAQSFPLYRVLVEVPESPAAQTWSLIFMLVFFPSMFSLFALTAKRLHDFGRNGIEAVAMIIPFISVIAFVFFCLKPGDPGPNAHGRLVNTPED